MKQMGIQDLKLELLQSIMHIDSEDVLNELMKVIEECSVKLPCQHTENEVLKSADEAIKALESGDMTKFVSHEKLKNKHTA